MMTKKAQVIPLPIKEADGKYHILWTNKNGQWLYTHSSADNLIPQHLYFTTDDEIKAKDWILIKDEHIRQVTEVGDGKYLSVNTNNALFKSICKKIVATTNKELWYSKYAKGLCPKCKSKLEVRLPETLWCENEKCDYSAMNLVRGVSEELVQCTGKIPTDFIEAYVREQGRIKEVLLEYEGFVSSTTWEHDHPEGYRLKLRPNGTVFIHRVKEKKYTRDDVIKIAKDIVTYALSNDHITRTISNDHIDMWFNANYPE